MRAASLPGLAKTTSVNDGETNTCRSAFAYRCSCVLRTQGNHRQIAGRANVARRGHTGKAGDLGVFWIYRMDAAAVAPLAQHLHEAPAGTRKIVAGTDHGNATWMQQPVENSG